jgi:hypothetical protein
VVVSIVAKALDADIERGALLSIAEAGTRVRVLPLRRSQDLPQHPSAGLSDGRLRFPWLPRLDSRGGEQGGGITPHQQKQTTYL